MGSVLLEKFLALTIEFEAIRSPYELQL